VCCVLSVRELHNYAFRQQDDCARQLADIISHQSDDASRQAQCAGPPAAATILTAHTLSRSAHTARCQDDDVIPPSDCVITRNGWTIWREEMVPRLCELFFGHTELCIELDELLLKIHELFPEHNDLFVERNETFMKLDKTFWKLDKTFRKLEEAPRNHEKAPRNYDEAFARIDRLFANHPKALTRSAQRVGWVERSPERGEAKPTVPVHIIIGGFRCDLPTLRTDVLLCCAFDKQISRQRKNRLSSMRKAGCVIPPRSASFRLPLIWA